MPRHSGTSVAQRQRRVAQVLERRRDRSSCRCGASGTGLEAGFGSYCGKSGSEAGE